MITTHVLDTFKGTPGMGIDVHLRQVQEDGKWLELGQEITDSDGRVKVFGDGSGVDRTGSYHLVFETKDYFGRLNQDTFYHEIVIEFYIDDIERDYHIPLLLNPYGYTTYRGS
ncbi:hydroxyisourate hydrolase [Bacteriovoracaceae bacterium]|nr:hydroxyisourate hydrolase [Bacteriovoracaceae bacterium]